MSLKNRSKISTILLWAMALALFAVSALAQMIDKNRASNLTDDGINKSLTEQIGAGRGDWMMGDYLRLLAQVWAEISLIWFILTGQKNRICKIKKPFATAMFVGARLLSVCEKANATCRLGERLLESKQFISSP